MMDGFYGEAPVSLGRQSGVGDISEVWHEFMHYLYLPVRLPKADGGVRSGDDITLPARLDFLRTACYVVLDNATDTTEHLGDPYVYVTAHRGFATPGNPLNRPGWHCDDFGGTDLNYIWADRCPTQIMTSEQPIPISEDDAESMADMDAWHLAWDGEDEDASDLGIDIVDAPLNHLLRLTPYVIHAAPDIREAGMRSFFKISVSTHRYNLRGNSHNHLLDYDWPMYSREALRNQPQGSSDYVEEKVR